MYTFKFQSLTSLNSFIIHTPHVYNSSLHSFKNQFDAHMKTKENSLRFQGVPGIPQGDGFHDRKNKNGRTKTTDLAT